MEVTGWARYPRVNANIKYCESVKECQQQMANCETVLARGMGRSYGDSALNNNLISMLGLRHLLAFEPDTGQVRCEAGITLSELIDIFLPRGWFLPVTPGTQFVTVGGAIASDVHGKNHHRHGCFSEFVLSLELLLATGVTVTCSRETNSELFFMTCGGMGLTGIILSATVQLTKVESAYIDETIYRAANLEEAIQLFEQHIDATYSVAWIDCLAKGASLGRSLVMFGEHAKNQSLQLPEKKTLAVPVDLPSFLLNQYSVRLFNHFYYHRRREKRLAHTVPIMSFFYPLDGILHWNRLYGRQGFLQYQCVFPKDTGTRGLFELIETIANAQMGSFLAVLKLFGKENRNHLSFPMEGYTLALDFKYEPRLFPFLHLLDSIVAAYGGRLYLTKDARMPQQIFQSTYPRWEEFRNLREQMGMNKKFNSLQSHRLEI